MQHTQIFQNLFLLGSAHSCKALDIENQMFSVLWDIIQRVVTCPHFSMHRSAYYCRFFVLPCCFFDFCGKYQRRQCKKSQYREYVDFISEVSAACGFQTDEDCLRIPSTKRVCFFLFVCLSPPPTKVFSFYLSNNSLLVR